MVSSIISFNFGITKAHSLHKQPPWLQPLGTFIFDQHCTTLGPINVLRKVVGDDEDAPYSTTNVLRMKFSCLSAVTFDCHALATDANFNIRPAGSLIWAQISGAFKVQIKLK